MLSKIDRSLSYKRLSEFSRCYTLPADDLSGDVSFHRTYMRFRVGRAPRAVDVSSGEACIVGGELDVNGGEFDGLAWTAEDGRAAEPLVVCSGAPPLICSGVQTGPGATPLTRIRLGPSCSNCRKATRAA